MPIHRGQRLDDLISRLAYRAIPIAANVYKTWPNLASGVSIGTGTPGPWVEVIAAASSPTVPFTIAFVHAQTNGQTGNSAGLVEIGVGASGSETAVSVAGVSAYTNGASYAIPYPLPIIPGGSRVAIRLYGSNAANLIKVVSAILPTRLDPYSMLRLAAKQSSFYPGVSAMTSFTGNIASVGTWGYSGYTELYAATVESSASIITGITWMSINSVGQVAFATGGAGSEVVWGEFPIAQGTSSGFHLDLPIPLVVPGSTRHAAKYADPSNGVLLYYSTPTFSKGAVAP